MKRKYQVEFSSTFQMEVDVTETVEVMEDRAWDMLNSGEFEWDLYFEEITDV